MINRRIPEYYGAIPAGPAMASAPPTTLLTIFGNLAWWFRSDLGITIGTGVSAWADQSGNGVNALQGTGSKQPVVNSAVINGRDSIKSDNVDDFLVATWARLAPGTQPFYMTLLARQNSWSSGHQLVNDGGSGIYNLSSTPGFRQFNGVNGPLNNGATVGSFKIFEAQYLNSTSDYLRIGGTSLSATNTGNSAGLGSFGLFATAAGASVGDYEICEAACYLGTASAQNRSDVQAYYTALYGASVAT